MTEPLADNFACTDLGNAERLAAWHGSELRHVPAWGWLAWTGKVWQRSDKLAVKRAKETTRRIYQSALDSADEGRRKALAAHAVQTEGRHRIAAMLALAESDPIIAAEPSDFDRDTMLLNCRNGTVDLRTGEARPHRGEDLITKLVEVDYDPGAASELWDRFLAAATAGKDGLADFLRRAAGYTLTGETREEAIFAAHGPGGTGKTTFVEAVKAMLGPYAGSIRIEALTTSSRATGGHNEDVARLVGLRMVTAVEASEEERLREGQVKHMTGGDTIPASLKHRPGFDFVPVFKLWLATNEVPYIRSDDSGMWRRLHKLPFDNQHGKSDLKDHLKRPAHLRAILAWAVRGCLEWQRDGLGAPACVTAATRDLRRWMDGGFEQFLAEHCQLGDWGHWAATRSIRGLYTRWAAAMGIPEARRISDNRLAALLRRRGCEWEQRRPGGPDSDLMRGWWGIRVFDCPTCTACTASCNFSAMSRVREEKVADTGTGGTGGQNGHWQNVCGGCGANLLPGATRCWSCSQEVSAG